jgi:hypothetical protein
MIKVNVYKVKKNNNLMQTKLISLIILSIFLVSFVSANLGTYKQGDCVNIKTILNSSSVNISTISYPNSIVVISNQIMTKQGQTFNYTFCNTSNLGTYIYDYFDSNGDVYVNSFDVTPSGFTDTLGFYFVLLLILGGVIVLGFAIKEGWFVVIGGMGLMILGIYSVINGIAGFKDMFMTYAVSVFFVGVGAYLSFKSAIEMVEENLG